MYTPWWYQIYLLQLENYEINRFFNLLHLRGFWPEKNFKPRLDLVWTKKLIVTTLLAFILPIGFLTVWLFPSSNLMTHLILTAVALLTWVFLWPFLLVISLIILKPLDLFAKHIVTSRANAKIKLFPKLPIIAIAGSYGNTTVKEIVAAALNSSIVLKTPDNVNTPLGIAKLINKTDMSKVDCFVTEMGEYYRGDIAELATLVPPGIVIISGVNEAHFERLGNLDTTIETIFEAVAYSPQEATVILNADDVNIVTHYQKFVGTRKVMWYSSLNDSKCPYRAEHIEFHNDGSGISFAVFKGKGDMVGKGSTKLLGNYALGTVFLGLMVAELLGVEADKALAGIAECKPVVHRLEPLPGAHGILVIDDSYNGNPAGVKEALAVLRQFKNRRTVYLTPGLVEMGSRTEDIHLEIGRELAKSAQLILLIKNSVTPLIAKGLAEAGFAKDSIMWFNSATEAHGKLSEILKPNDVILFQNDWGDNYV